MQYFRSICLLVCCVLLSTNLTAQMMRGPQFDESVTVTPTVPTAIQDVAITEGITGNNISVADLIYTVNGGGETTVNMTNTGGDTYSGVIPNAAYTDGDRVEYYFYAEDDDGDNTSGVEGFFAGSTDISAVLVNDGNGYILYPGYYARVTGVATISSSVIEPGTRYDFYLQDGTGGILIRVYGGSFSASEGNSYTAVGYLRPVAGQIQLQPDDPDADITDHGASTLPDIQILSIAQILATPEDYENEYIGIQSLSKSSGTWPTSGNGAELTMTDDGGSNTLTLYVDEDTDLDENTEPAWPKDVKGILYQYDTSSPYNSGYRILPRSYADIVTEGSLPVELSSYSAKSLGSAVVLIWSTESEIENLGFILERKDSRSSWDEIASYLTTPALEGQGSTNSFSQYSYTNKNTSPGETYTYHLSDVSYSGKITKLGTCTVKLAKDSSILGHNFPNPFNPSTIISYTLPEASHVSLEVFDLHGRLVASLYQGHQTAEPHQIQWNGTDDSGNRVSTGVYLCQLSAEGYQKTIKMVYMK